jgi:pyruvate dehydrogenase E2 component (dihydrolipoamide acetyltransferase)
MKRFLFAMALTALAQAHALAQTPPPAPAPAPAPSQPPAPAQAPAPPSDTVTVIINTSPPSTANVYWGRKLLGKITPARPLVLSRARDSGPLDISVRALGFLTVVTRAHTFSDNRVIVKLTLPENASTLLGYKAPQPITESPEQAAAMNALAPTDPNAPPAPVAPVPAPDAPLEPAPPPLLQPAPPPLLQPAPPPSPLLP